jgi:hypothetical protein
LQVTPDKGDDDDLGFLALEVVNGCGPDTLEKRCLAGLFPLRRHRGLSVSVFKIFQLSKIAIVEADLEHGLHSTPQLV